MRLRGNQTAPSVPVRPPAPEPAQWLEQAEHRRLTVHTVADQSIQGTLRLAAPDGLLLWSVKMLTKNGAVQMEGEVFIPREQVAFVQTMRM